MGQLSEEHLRNGDITCGKVEAVMLLSLTEAIFVDQIKNELKCG